MRACSGSAPAWRWPRPCCSPTFRACRRRTRRPASAWRAAASGSRRAPTAVCGSSRRRRSRSRSCCSRARGMLLATLVALQTANTGYDMRQVLAFDIPTPATGVVGAQTVRLLPGSDAARRRSCPGVEGVALGIFVPWRDAGGIRRRACSSPSTATSPPTAKKIRARGSASSRPRFFAVLGVPMLAGRDFTDEDRAGSEPVVDRQPERRAAAVPERRRGEPEACGGLDPYFGKPVPRRIVGVVADVDDENVVRGPALTVYQPGAADRRRPGACSCARPAIRTRWCRR